jgi:Bacterial Ig-like domain (group 2)
MRRLLLVVTLLAMVVGCDSKSPTAPTIQPPTPTPTPTPPAQAASVTISGDTKFTALNNVRQFTATARMQDGSLRDVTGEANWSSSNTAVASVSGRGEVTSVGPGFATIFVSYVAVGASIDVSVAPATSSAIAGLYRFVIAAAPECSALPDWAQRREYDVRIDQPEAEQPGTETALTLTAQLEPGVAPQLPGSIRGSIVRFQFPGGNPNGSFYYYYYTPIWPTFANRIDTNSLYTLSGEASGTKGASQNVQISGVFSGIISAVNPSTNVTFADCTSVHHSFTLSRQ